MSEWKWVFHNYQVQECDEFASYLEAMARQGWHFKEWKNRLGFIKGEPEEAVYDVQVFSKARMNDLKAEGETLVYSDYCQAAGWELVDSKGKFCIFKQIQDDAVPIVTNEEKIDNVKESYHKLIRTPILFTFLLLLQVMTFLQDPVFELFDNLSIMVDVLWIALVVYSWMKYIIGLRDMNIAIHRYETTGELFFGRKLGNEPKLIAGYPLTSVAGITLLYVVILIAFAWWGDRESLVFIIVSLALILGISFWNQNARPGRKGRRFSTVFMLVAFILFIVIFTIWGVSHTDSETDTMSSETAFGYWEEDEDYIRYHWNSWVPDGMKDWAWNSSMKDAGQSENTATVTEKWRAQDCAGDGDPLYLKYEDDILHVWFDEEPSQQEIDQFLDKEGIH